MTLSELFLPEFDNEMKGTRRTLERVPESKFAWKPHEKSGTMGWLAGHLANLPSWATFTVSQDSLDLMPGGKPLPQLAAPATTAELLATFDSRSAEGRAAIAAASDEALRQPWTLYKNGQQLLTMPKFVVLRNFVLNHIIHHRAQLGVYLRLNNLPVPSIYGPSADEAPF
jgi:uncharacterized damage-inducible protein DinB